MKNVNSSKSAFTELEEEIKKAFSAMRPEDNKVSKLLSRMKLKPIENLLHHKYNVWLGDRRFRYDPMSVMKSIILKELLCMSSYMNLIRHLHNYNDESRDLGYSDDDVPTQQIFSVIRNEKMDEEIWSLIFFVAEKIRKTAIDNEKLLDIDFLNRKNDTEKKSERTLERYKTLEGSKIIRMLKEEIFPTLKLPLKCNARYAKENFLDLLAYVAFNHMYANGGSEMMRMEEEFEGKVPHARTLMGYLAKLDKDEILEMYVAAFERVFKIAKDRGLLKGEVDVALDFHDWLFYGDENDVMVVRGEYKNGTDKRFRFLTIKITERYGDFTLMALPIGIFTNHVEAVRKLIEYAKEKVKPRYFYVDRGFFSSKYVSLFEELGIKYLMPGVKNERVERLIEKYGGSTRVIDYRMKVSKEESVARTKLVVMKDKDGKNVCFSTNLPTIMLYTHDLFQLYKKRWGIETGYRVQKYEFRPNTTSKNYKIRTFYFMFSTLLYNLWVTTNSMLSEYLFGEYVEYRLITAKMFMKKFYEAYNDEKIT